MQVVNMLCITAGSVCIGLSFGSLIGVGVMLIAFGLMTDVV